MRNAILSRWTAALLLVLCACALAGCSGGGAKSTSTSSSTQAQTSLLSATLVNETTDQAMAGLQVTVEGTGLGDVTDSKGNFEIANVPVGSQVLIVSSLDGTVETTHAITVAGPTTALGIVTLTIEGNPPGAPPI